MIRKSEIQMGFTLMELMVVVAIIGLLAGIMIPNLANRIERAKVAKAESDISSIEASISMYEVDTGYYPEDDTLASSIESLELYLTGRNPATGVTDTNITTHRDWHGPYIKGIEDDPWDTPYVYMKNSNPKSLASLPGPTPGVDYPANNHGGAVDAPDNMHYYLYSTGKDRDTGTPATAEDDINNWDVEKTWKEAY